MRIMCYSKETYKIIQEHLFDQGYVWVNTGDSVWYPKYAEWKNGLIIEWDENSKHHKDIYTSDNFRSQYNMDDIDFIDNEIKKDGGMKNFYIEHDIKEEFDNIISEI